MVLGGGGGGGADMKEPIWTWGLLTAISIEKCYRKQKKGKKRQYKHILEVEHFLYTVGIFCYEWYE